MRHTLLGAVTALLLVVPEAHAEETPYDAAGDFIGVAAPLEDRYADPGAPVLREVSALAAQPPANCAPRCYRKKWLGLDWSAGLYGWLTSVSGTSYGAGERTEFDIPFADIFDSTSFGVLGVLRAKKGPWWAEANVVYGNLGADVGRVIDEDFLTVDAEFDIERWQVDLMVGYDFLRRPMPVYEPYTRCKRRCLELGVFGGVRWTRTEIDATIEGSIIGLPIGSTISETDTDLLPIGGLWLRVPFASRWSFEARGWVGGWDGFRWQAQAFVNYQFARQWGVFVGWRAEGTDDTTGSGGSREGLQLNLDGPLIGVGFGW